jgi:superfamily II DNA or RNA helicase
MKDYIEFLRTKRFVLESSGFDIDQSELNQMLYGFQKDIVRWALKKGKACIFADCGLGKTPIQLSWAYQVHIHTDLPVLILAPLAVAEQTHREAIKFGYNAKVCESQDDVINGINITNYEKLDKFVANEFVGIVLDESSILKSYSGKVRTSIIECFSATPYKLACTATPAPNDYMEMGNHAEFCGVMTRSEMLSMFFVHDGGQTSKWRLKGHAEDVFWQWLATFSVFVDNPKNIGYDVSGYDLPPLNIHEIVVDGDEPTTEILTLTERRQARKDSLELRCQQAAELVNGSDEQWVVWCDLNCESEMLHTLIDNSVEVRGSDKQEHKSKAMLGFSDGVEKCIVTKPSIAGFGMNWQNCSNMIFTGLSDSYEQYYQAVRRCYRFGQTKEVNVYIIISAKEGCVRENIERKQADFLKMQREMTEYTKEITKKELRNTCRISTPYEPIKDFIIPNWEEFVNDKSA